MWTGPAQSRPVTSGSPLKPASHHHVVSAQQQRKTALLRQSKDRRSCFNFSCQNRVKDQGEADRNTSKQDCLPNVTPERAMSFPETARGVTQGSRKEKSSFRFSPVPIRAGLAQWGRKVTANPCLTVRSRQLLWLPRKEAG